MLTVELECGELFSKSRGKTLELVNDPTFVEFDLSDFVQYDSVDGIAFCDVVEQCDHMYAAKAKEYANPDHLYTCAPPKKNSKKRKFRKPMSVFSARQKFRQRSVAKAVRCVVSKACKKTVKNPRSVLAKSPPSRVHNTPSLLRLPNVQPKRRGQKFHKHANGLKVTKSVLRVLKKIHPQSTISVRGMVIVNDFLGDMFEKLAITSRDLMRKVGRKTLMARDVAGAVRLEMKGELQMFTMQQGLQALTLVADSFGLDTREMEQRKFKKNVKKAKL